jgi:hypothetical protein
MPSPDHSTRTLSESKALLRKVVNAKIRSARDFANFIMQAPPVSPSHYSHGKGWRPSTDHISDNLNPTEEFVLRIAFELQNGMLDLNHFVDRPYNSLFGMRNVDGHHQRRYILRAKICKHKQAFTEVYFPWVLHIFSHV